MTSPCMQNKRVVLMLLVWSSNGPCNHVRRQAYLLWRLLISMKHEGILMYIIIALKRLFMCYRKHVMYMKQLWQRIHIQLCLFVIKSLFNTSRYESLLHHLFLLTLLCRILKLHDVSSSELASLHHAHIMFTLPQVCEFS